MRKPMDRRQALLLAAAFLGLALVTWLRIRLVNALPDQGHFAKYLIFADRILAGEMPSDRLADLSPGYLWFVVALRFFGAGFVAIRTLQIVLVSIASVLCGIAARRFGTLAMLLAPLLLLGSRAALVCATEAEPETLILLLGSAALAMLGTSATGAGLLFGLGAICRPVMLLAATATAFVSRSWRIALAALVPVVLMVGVNVALTGEAVLMDPGTVFYEGMNPSATGYEGVQPRIVNDIERMSAEPDYLHVAYRIVASRSAGYPLTRAQSNRFWTGKAFAFARAYPFAALRLVTRKALFSIQSHDAYDLSTMARKDSLLGRLPFIPFGLLVALAGAGLLRRRSDVAPRSASDVLPFVAFAVAGLIVLVAFYVTARQRNAMLPAMVVLAAAGLAGIVARRHGLAAILVVIVTVILTIDGPMQIEDTNGWRGTRNTFDSAVALEQQGRWMEADELLAQLQADGYQPVRENRAVSSVAFYRACAALHLGMDPRAFLARAEADAPGNEHVLAMRARLGDSTARGLLFDLHDRLTAQRALNER
jgi:hypothetical protein